MSGKAVATVGTIIGVVGTAGVATFFAINPDKARELANAAWKGVENTADKIIENVGDWVEDTVVPEIHKLAASVGLIGQNSADERYDS